MKRIVIVGFGNLGQAILPLLKKEFPAHVIVAFDRDVSSERLAVACAAGIEFHHTGIDEHNYRALLGPLLSDGSYLLNVAVEVSTIDLVALAQEHGAFYLDAGIEPWAYQEPGGNGLGMTSNYALREQVMACRAAARGKRTAVIAQGANPGFVSVLVKVALERMARKWLPEFAALAAAGRQEIDNWALLAERLGVRVIQVSECDTQVAAKRAEPGEFVCTWSVDGLITEALQSAEAGWGTHETVLPPNASGHATGCEAAIMFNRPGANLVVRSWSPNRLEFSGFLITHNEAISIADFLSVRVAGHTRYRPTVYYAYRPCDETVLGMKLIEDGTADKVMARRVVKDDVISGIDELGVLLLSDCYPSVWFGSNLSIGRARAIAAYNNATSLQVVSSIVGAMKWIETEPNLGIIESEQLDQRFMYDFVAPYWGPMVYEETDWKPDGDNLQFAAFVSHQPMEPGQGVPPMVATLPNQPG